MCNKVENVLKRNEPQEQAWEFGSDKTSERRGEEPSNQGNWIFQFLLLLRSIIVYGLEKICSERERRKESLKLSLLLMCKNYKETMQSTQLLSSASLWRKYYYTFGNGFNLNIFDIYCGLGVLINRDLSY